MTAATRRPRRGIPRRDEHPPLGSRDGDDRYELTQAERVRRALEADRRYQRARTVAQHDAQVDALVAAVQQNHPATGRPTRLATADLVGAFLAARCRLDGRASVARSALFDAWSAWAVERGVQHGSRAAFSTLLRAAAPSVRSVRRGRGAAWYDGVRLATAAEGAHDPEQPKRARRAEARPRGAAS